MKKLAFFIFLFLIQLATATTLFDNGSFETGDTQNWTIKSSNDGCNYSVVEDTNATDGSYVFRTYDDSATDNYSCNLYYESLNVPMDANIIFDATINGVTGVNKDIDIKIITRDENGTIVEGATIFYSQGGTTTEDWDQDGSFTFSKLMLNFYDTNSALSGTDANIVIYVQGDTDVPTYSVDIDNFRYNTPIYLINELDYPTSQSTNADFNIYNSVTNTLGETVTNADCNADISSWIAGDVNANMVYDSVIGKYYVQTSLTTTGSHDFNVSCALAGTRPDTDTGTITFVVDLSDETNVLKITPISNVTKNQKSTVIELSPSEYDETISWKAESFYDLSLSVDYNIFNPLTDGRQYFIYTSSDGNNFEFDDTLTFGSTNSNPIQKIWDEVNDRYSYNFTDVLTPNETKYYRLTYRNPYKHYFSINNLDWFNNLVPFPLDTNSIPIDLFSVSQYSNIRSIFKEEVPDIFGDDTQAFEFQLTAWSEDSNSTLHVGQTINGIDSTSSVSLTTSPHRYSFAIDATDFDSQLILISTNSGADRVYITDYAIVPRAYFTKRLELVKPSGDLLTPLLFNGLSRQYIQEGSSFRTRTEAYDREGNLIRLDLHIFLDNTDSQNLAQKQIIPLDFDEEIITSFDYLHSGVIDLNGNASNPNPPHNLIVQAHLIDANGFSVAVQSESVVFLEYPYFPSDFTINFYPTEKRLGKNPAGILQTILSNPSALEGFDFRIYSDTNTVTSPNYQAKLFKGTDFTCVGSICNLQVKFTDYLYEDINLTTITVFALLNTEYLDVDNNLTRADRRIFVTPIEFDTAKIYQVNERLDRTYRNDEEIQLVLILKDSEATDVSDKIETYLTLENCDAAAAGNCTTQTSHFKPTGFAYDPQFNLNYYFFRQIFILDDGSLLPDGNYIGFRATINDKTGVRTGITPLLVDRCQNQNYAADFVNSLGNPLGLGSFILNTTSDILLTQINGCQPGSEQYSITTTTTNSGEEIRLLIDQDHSLSSPAQEALICVAPDTNNVIGNPLKQDILCVSLYQVGEKPIDDFRLRIMNPYSDLKEEGSTKQYKEFNIPYELISINDAQLLRKELETNQDTTINTVADFIYYGFRNLGKGIFLYSGAQDLINLTAGKGLIQNVGADISLSDDFNSVSVGGAIFFKIKGIPVVNIQDYRNDSRLTDSFETVDPKFFLKYLSEKNISIPQETATMEAIVSDISIPQKFTDSEGVLLINEEPTQQNVNTSNLDANQTAKYTTIPNILNFTIQSTMFYNNESQNDTRSIILNIAIIIRDTFYNSALEGISGLVKDPGATAGTFILNNILWIVLILGIFYVVSLIYRNFKEKESGG